MTTISERGWLFIRVLWVLAGLTFTIARISHEGPDNTAIAGLVFTFAVFLLPMIKALKLPGGTEVQLQPAKIEELAVTEDELFEDLGALLVSYTSAIGATSAVLANGASPESKAAFALLKCAKAIEDSLSWFAVAEPVRVLIYRLRSSATAEALVFVVGNVDGDESVVLKRGGFPIAEEDDDPLARCWRLQRIFNLSETAADDRPQVVRGHQVYHGIMTIPVRRVDERWGVLVVERQQAKAFDATAQQVGTALGNVVAAALAHPAVAL